MYSLVTVDGGWIKKTKDVNENVVDGIRYKEYIDMYFGKGLMRHCMKKIQSKSHKTGIYEVCKISLSYFDDTHYILDDSVNTLAYFHGSLLNQ